MWFEIVTKNKLTHNNKLLRWIGYGTEFSPNRRDNKFKNWEQGPHMFWELLENKKCKSFEEIKEQFGLVNQDFYRFLQMRHYLEHDIKKENFDVEVNIIKLFISAYQSKLNKKLI